MKKIIALVLTVLLLATTVFAGAADKLSSTVASAIIVNTDGGSRPTAGNVAKIGGINVSKELYNLVADAIFSQSGMYELFGSDAEKFLSTDIGDGTTVEQYIRESVIAYITQQIAIVKLAEKEGIVLGKESEAKLKEAREMMIEQFGGEENFKAYLTSGATSEEAFMQYEEWSYIINEYVKKATAEGGVAYVDTKTAEKQFKDKYFKAKLIVLAGRTVELGDGNVIQGKSAEEVKAIAEQINSRLENGETFETLIEDYNENGAPPEYMYTFAEGEIEPVIIDTVKSLKVGEYTKNFVQVGSDYAFVKRYDNTPEANEISQIAQVLSEEKLVETVDEYSKKIKASVNNELAKESIIEMLAAFK